MFQDHLVPPLLLISLGVNHFPKEPSFLLEGKYVEAKIWVPEMPIATRVYLLFGFLTGQT